jgi:hypothetical protein
MLGLVIAPIIGISIVLTTIITLRVPLEIVMDSVPLDQIVDKFVEEVKFVLQFNTHHIYGAMTISALIVHLWLPLFAACIIILKIANYFLLATQQTQWFLRRGKEHPLDALGFVAAAIVFLIAVSIQIFVSK